MSLIEAPSNLREICHRRTELVRNNPQQSKAIETKRRDPAITEVDPSERTAEKKIPSEHAKSVFQGGIGRDTSTVLRSGEC